jgi:hypothetical protein
MTVPDRSKHFALNEGPEPVERPRIWVQGRQRPRFNLQAYLATSLGMAKRDLAPEVLDASDRLQALGARVLAGEMRVNVAWAGRLSRAVPSCGRVGGWIVGLEGLLRGAHDLLVPPTTAEAPIAYPYLVTRPPEPAAPALPQPPGRVRVDPTLHAIRAALGDIPHDARFDTAQRPRAPHSPQPPESAARTPGQVRRVVWSVSCRVTLAILIAFALPSGAIKALLYHLNNGDLADWS